MKKYNSYKDSGVEWIGEIPNHWKLIRLNVLGEFSKGKGITKEKIKEEGFPCIRNGEIYTTYNRITNNIFSFIDEETTNESITVEKGTFLFTGDGETVEEIGKCLVYNGDESLYVGGGINIFKPRLDKVNHIYMSYVLNSESVVYQKSRDGRGEIVVHIYSKQLKEIKLGLPPLSEQQQIVSFLDNKTQKIDSLIQQKEKKIELLKEKRTSLINHVVTKGLDSNVEMKDSGLEWIGEIPNGWIKTKLKYVTNIYGRIGYRGYTVEDIVDEGEGVITISPSNINNDVFSTKNSTYITWDKYYESPEIQIFTNDIILVKTGSTIGKTSIIPEDVPEMTINPQLVVLKDVKLFPKYLYYQTTCRFIKESFLIEQTGSSTPTISQLKVNEFPLLQPSLLEQQQIVEYLDKQTEEIDTLIQLEQKKIDTLKEYRQSLISEVVTGKIKVCKEDNSLSLNSPIV